MYYLSWLVQLLCVALWLPPVQSKLVGTALESGPYLALPVSLAFLFMGVVSRVRTEEAGQLVRRVHGGAAALCASFLVQTTADATGIDLGEVALDAFDGGGEGIAVYWRLVFMIGMPAMMGIFLDDPVASVGKRLHRPFRKLSAVVPVLLAACLGAAAGALLQVVLWADLTGETIETARNLYWSTLGETGGIVFPIAVGVVLAMLEGVLPDRNDDEKEGEAS